jgi:hypothetical protein
MYGDSTESLTLRRAFSPHFSHATRALSAFPTVQATRRSQDFCIAARTSGERTCESLDMPERDLRPTPAWAEWLVRFLDDGLTIPGTKLRVGFDGLLGLIPGVGDTVSAASALSLFWLALRRGVPSSVLARMAANVALDTLFGSVPVLGDLFDFAFKANRRNLRLIEGGASQAVRERHLADYLVIVVFALIILSLITLPFLLTALLVANLGTH